jgi:hypothetical protein
MGFDNEETVKSAEKKKHRSAEKETLSQSNPTWNVDPPEQSGVPAELLSSEKRKMTQK